ncbi:hypothetical protein ANO11243_080840 [Dothideomycetidae sp. 11243]|nr:hypothetical protein ANO11243_080840 [fungal sp. No.11243]
MAKTTLPAAKAGSTPQQIVQRGVANATQFCNFWQQGLNNAATPFPQLGPINVSAACKTILHGNVLTKNMVANPYFEGSGSYSQSLPTTGGNTLLLPDWLYGGELVSVWGASNNTGPGNTLTLGTEKAGHYSFISQGPVTPLVQGTNYTFSFEDFEICEGPPCTWTVKLDDQVIWNHTITAKTATNIIVTAAPTRHSVTFQYEKSANNAAYVLALNTTAHGQSEWYISDLKLVPSS